MAVALISPEEKKEQVRYFDPLTEVVVEECLLHMAIANENRPIFEDLVLTRLLFSPNSAFFMYSRQTSQMVITNLFFCVCLDITLGQLQANKV
jgi:hypothetical protein